MGSRSAAFARAATSRPQASTGIGTSLAPCCWKASHAGRYPICSTATRSPGLSSARLTRSRAIWLPAVTATSSGVVARPRVAANIVASAARRSGWPCGKPYASVDRDCLRTARRNARASSAPGVNRTSGEPLLIWIPCERVAGRPTSGPGPTSKPARPGTSLRGVPLLKARGRTSGRASETNVPRAREDSIQPSPSSSS